MEIKLKSGRKLKVKNITLDERDGLLDSVTYEYKDDGGIRGVRMMYSTMTKWMRTCLVGDTSDKTLLGFTLEEKTEIFTKLQSMFFEGEENASK
jgi:hypothetical protein